MRLYLTVDIEEEGSGIDPLDVEVNPVQFARELLVKGAEEMEVGLALKEAACTKLPFHREKPEAALGTGRGSQQEED